MKHIIETKHSDMEKYETEKDANIHRNAGSKKPSPKACMGGKESDDKRNEVTEHIHTR